MGELSEKKEHQSDRATNQQLGIEMCQAVPGSYHKNLVGLARANNPQTIEHDIISHTHFCSDGTEHDRQHGGVRRLPVCRGVVSCERLTHTSLEVISHDDAKVANPSL